MPINYEVVAPDWFPDDEDDSEEARRLRQAWHAELEKIERFARISADQLFVAMAQLEAALVELIANYVAADAAKADFMMTNVIDRWQLSQLIETATEALKDPALAEHRTILSGVKPLKDVRDSIAHAQRTDIMNVDGKNHFIVFKRRKGQPITETYLLTDLHKMSMKAQKMWVQVSDVAQHLEMRRKGCDPST